MKQKRLLLTVVEVFIFLFFILLDQVTKYCVSTQLKGSENIPLIPNVLELTYLENRGAAFSILQNQKLFFIIITFIILAAIVFFIIKIPAQKKYLKLHIILSFIAAGAVGNVIDRIRLGYVVDFIYFSIIHFPVFNVADICITVSTFLMAFTIVFGYSEEDLATLRKRKKNTV